MLACTAPLCIAGQPCTASGRNCVRPRRLEDGAPHFHVPLQLCRREHPLPHFGELLRGRRHLARSAKQQGGRQLPRDDRCVP